MGILLETVQTVYERNGYKDRTDYFQQLAAEYNCPVDVVESVADMLGENEDFDGLVSSMEDWEETRGC